MIVTVTRAHIVQGHRHHHFNNPIALAAQQSDKHAVVTADKVHLVSRIADLPARAKAWLLDFNACKNVQPLEFVV